MEVASAETADLTGALEVKVAKSSSKRRVTKKKLMRDSIGALTGKKPGGMGPPAMPSVGIWPKGLGAGPVF